MVVPLVQCLERDAKFARKNGRVCPKKCESDSDCKSDKKCVCDGLCGKTCQDMCKYLGQTPINLCCTILIILKLGCFTIDF